MFDKKYKIRNAGFADAGNIFTLIRQNPKELIPRSVSDIVENTDRFIVAETGGKIVGTVSWQILPEIGLPRDPSVEIKSLSVAAAHQKKGLGIALAKAAMDRILLLRPAQLIVLTFHPEFFRQLGFREVSKRKLMNKLYVGCANCTKYDSPFVCPEVAMCLKVRNRSG